MFRKIALAVASVAAVAAMTAGPAGATSGLTIRESLGGHDAMTVEFNMDGSGWNASVHKSSAPTGTYRYVVVANGSVNGHAVSQSESICSVTLKSTGIVQCAGRFPVALTFSPTSFSLNLYSGSNLMVSKHT